MEKTLPTRREVLRNLETAYAIVQPIIVGLCHEQLAMLEAIDRRNALISRMERWILQNKPLSTATIHLTPGPYEIDIIRKIIADDAAVLISEAEAMTK